MASFPRYSVSSPPGRTDSVLQPSEEAQSKIPTRKKKLAPLPGFVAIGVILTGLLALLFLQNRSLSQARLENQALRYELRQMGMDNKLLLSQLNEAGSSVLVDNVRFRELLRLKSQPPAASPSTESVSSALAKAARNETAPQDSPTQAEETLPDPSKVLPRESWAFSAYATPEAALQSVAWAMSQGNLEVFLASMDPSDRAEAERQFAGKTEEESAAVLRAYIAPVRALRLDRKQVLEDGQVSFVLYSAEQDDGNAVTKDSTVLTLRNVDGDWRMSLNPEE